jgi:hypothetical protein
MLPLLGSSRSVIEACRDDATTPLPQPCKTILDERRPIEHRQLEPFTDNQTNNMVSGDGSDSKLSSGAESSSSITGSNVAVGLDPHLAIHVRGLRRRFAAGRRPRHRRRRPGGVGKFRILL